MVRVLLAIALLLGVLVLTWMSFLRVNNLAHDVKVLQEEVARLKGGEAAARPDAEPSMMPPPVGIPPPVPPTVAAGPTPLPAATAPPAVVEARPAGFLDEDQPEQLVALATGGTEPRGAEVTILGIQGEGSSEVILPDPIAMTLQPGVPHAVTGICQGPDTAAWVFTLERSAIRVSSRECQYPVRGLRPRLRVRLLR